MSHVVQKLVLTTSSFPAVPKGGWESTDRTLEAAAQREAVEEGPAICILCAVRRNLI